MQARFSLLLLVLALSACSVFRPVEQDLRLRQFPSHFSLYSETTEHSGKWWQDFGSEELNSLIAEAAGNNFSVREAYARLEQARYAALKEGASIWPELSGSAGVSDSAGKSGTSSNATGDSWSLGLTASYEIDLWGRLQAGRENKGLLEQASAEDLQSALISVTAQITEDWLALISTRRQQKLYNEQLALQNELLDLIMSRFSLAKSTALDIYQQQQAIEKIKAALIPLYSKEKNLKRRLALLLGKATLEDKRLVVDRFPTLSDLPEIGLPADLLAARPDIRAAGLRLHASEWEIAAARADRLPALRLTASVISSADALDSLFDNWLRNLAANLVLPLLDGKRRQSEVERLKAVADERLATYSKTVFTAIRETEDALTEEEKQRQTVTSLKRQLNLSAQTVNEARRRYLNGNSDFLNVLREELNVLQVKQDLIIAKEQLLDARVNLHKALGGSWTKDLMAELKNNQ